jgi:hypothetical protein
MDHVITVGDVVLVVGSLFALGFFFICFAVWMVNQGYWN